MLWVTFRIPYSVFVFVLSFGWASVFRIPYPYPYSVFSALALSELPYSVFRIRIPYSVLSTLALSELPYSVFRIRIPYSYSY